MLKRIEEIFFNKCDNVPNFYYICNKNCEKCKLNSVKMVIGGSAVICGGVVGSLSCVVSYIGSHFDPMFFDPYLIFGITGMGALIGGMIGLIICIEEKLVNIDQAALKAAVEQSNRERAGCYMENMSRYNQQISDYQHGTTKHYPRRPDY